MVAEKIRGCIGVLFTRDARSKKPKPFRYKDDDRAYALFSRKANKRGIRVVFSHYKNYRSPGVLRAGWEYKKTKNEWKKVKRKAIDLVYVRFNGAAFNANSKSLEVEALKYNMAKEVVMINHPALEEFCWDKRVIADALPQHCPKSFIVNTLSGLQTVLSAIQSEKIVLKPRFGSLGKGVLITDRNNLPASIEPNTLVQEFIDTSSGINGITEGVHDLRIIITNGKIDHAHVRMAKPGMLVANMAQGGTRKFVEVEKLPPQVLSIVADVDRMLSKYYPRLYSVDFMFDSNQRPYIVECNSSPVIKRYAYGIYKKPEFFDRIIDSMIAGIRMKVEKDIE